MQCTACGQSVPPNLRYCPACGADAGFPNVRLASDPEEKKALAKRVGEAEVSTDARKCRTDLEAFAKSVARSKVVIARSLLAIHELVSSDNNLYVSYYKQIQSGSRVPEKNAWDKGRTAADSTVSPHFHEDIVYGALSLDGVGLKSFGPYSIVLREPMIELRSTVFEENPFIFCKRHKIHAGQLAPPGYRAVWSERHSLAKAKLHPKIVSELKPADFSGLLLANAGRENDDDFIEVHIYGQVHRAAIERIIGPRPSDRRQLAIWRAVEGKLKQIGAVMDVR